MSSPHYPQSNGHAEVALKAMKTLITKTTQNGDLGVESFQPGLLERRNTSSSDGRSPVQKLFGKPLPSFLQAHLRSFAPSWQLKADEADAAPRQNVTTSPDTTGSARGLCSLSLGTHVDVQDPGTKLWDRLGVIVAIGQHHDSFFRMCSGRAYWRNRCFLRPFISLICSSKSSSQTSRTTSTSSQADGPPGSTRMRNTSSCLNISDTSRQSYV